MGAAAAMSPIRKRGHGGNEAFPLRLIDVQKWLVQAHGVRVSCLSARYRDPDFRHHAFPSMQPSVTSFTSSLATPSFISSAHVRWRATIYVV